MSDYNRPTGPQYKRVTVTVDPDVWQALMERNKNMSAICRDALARELQRCLSDEVARSSAAQQPTKTGKVRR